MEFINALLTHFEDIRVLFFSYMVQTSLVAFSGLALVGVRLKLSQVLAVGIPLAFYMYLEKALMLTYQYSRISHILLLVIGFILAIRVILGLPVVTTFFATIFSYIIVIASENLFFMLIATYLNIDLKHELSNPWLQCALGLLPSIPLLVLGGAAYFSRFSLLKLSGSKRKDLFKISSVGFRNNL